jgi:hypothetical protein
MMLFFEIEVPFVPVAIFVFCVTLKICLFKDLSIFIKITSKGAISVFSLMVFIFGVGLNALKSTNFKLTVYPETEIETGSRSIPLYNFNPAPLAGVLAIGYFIHPCVVPVIKKTSIPANYERDISYGYFLVFLSYFLVGLAGFFGF